MIEMEVTMFDPQKILQQVLGGSGEPDDQGQRQSKGGVSSDTLKGAAFGGLAGLLLGTKSGRSLAGSALKVGGVAVLGGLAYKAWQNWQAQQGGNAPAPADTIKDAASKAEGTTFLPSQVVERNDLSLTLLSAMIAAAKSDGHIDADEQGRIFARVDQSNLAADEKGFLMDQIRKPLDLDAIAAKATTMERAAEIYAASVLAINADNPIEVEYLDKLASSLKLDRGLRTNIEAEVKSAASPA
jgi:uncharacterized membrane protein YebE (DUF533 family)